MLMKKVWWNTVFSSSAWNNAKLAFMTLRILWINVFLNALVSTIKQGKEKLKDLKEIYNTIVIHKSYNACIELCKFFASKKNPTWMNKLIFLVLCDIRPIKKYHKLFNRKFRWSIIIQKVTQQCINHGNANKSKVSSYFIPITMAKVNMTENTKW
jgi:hypothetical protein